MPNLPDNRRIEAMTVSRSQPITAQQLRDQAACDHDRGCMGRCYSCECGYDTATDALLVAGANRIEELESALRCISTPVDVAALKARIEELTAVDARGERIREALEAVLAYEQQMARHYQLSDCTCMLLSREAEAAYEAGQCPHQKARAALTPKGGS